ncbi:42797_t:CDS:2 [Gigaspora margarita]|uniref:42797_t:CDS:1 n=1 Tax=Gigaspora margarita TaxID=4874 RepID=A0ABN7UHJ0_GIGMA|nr:42797_t:CDS:2 [Gigaspora margarita]
MDIELVQLTRKLKNLNNKLEEKNINTIKIIEKVAKIDYVNEIFELEDVKILNKKYYTK